MSTQTPGYRQRDTHHLELGERAAYVEDDLYDAFRSHKSACRERLGWKEITNEEFLQVLLDVYALHLEHGGDE